MPYKQAGSPYWWINKSYPGIGRVQKSTLTKKRETAKQMELLLDRLYSSGKAKFVAELKKGLFSLPWLYSKDIAGELDTVVSSATIKPLAGLLEWIESHPKFAPDTKRSYASLARKVVALFPGKSVHDMGEVLRDFRTHCEREGITRGFNQTRTLFQSFATHVDGRHKPLWVAITNVPPITYEVDSGRSLTYTEVRNLGRKLLGASTSDDRFTNVEILWSLALTGMRKSEYLADWEVAQDRVIVKRSAKARQSGMKERVIPRINHPFEPTITTTGLGGIGGPVDPGNKFQTFERRLRKATNNGVSPHDLRHTFRTWLLHAGVPEVRAETYMGHKVNSNDVKKLYTQHDVIPHLSEDAKLLQRWLAKQEEHWCAHVYEHGIEHQGDDDSDVAPEIEYGRSLSKTAGKPRYS